MDALVYLLQAIYKARTFFTDSSKEFYLVDHILTYELQCLNVHPVLVNWIEAFLSNRMQTVKIGNTISEFKSTSVRLFTL